MRKCRALVIRTSFILSACLMVFGGTVYHATPAHAFGGGGGCCLERRNCDNNCVEVSEEQRDETIEAINEEFADHQEWIMRDVFETRLLPALMLFAEQMTATAIYQVFMIGAMLDAKHQLETQRIFQVMMAEAHAEYQPSETMCSFGSLTRSLAASQENATLTAATLSARAIQRENLSGSGLSANGRTSDYTSRIAQYLSVPYCNPADNGNGLTALCPNGGGERANKDINYTRTVDSKMTLEMNFDANGAPTPDAEDVLALDAYLFASEVRNSLPMTFFTQDNGAVNKLGPPRFMDLRANTAKRSIARAPFLYAVSVKTEGAPEVQPLLRAVLAKKGLSEQEIILLIGENASQDAQMEILVKELHDLAEFYDTPENIARINGMILALILKQRYDLFRIALRGEAVLATMLETALDEQQEKVGNEIRRLNDDGELVDLGPVI